MSRVNKTGKQGEQVIAPCPWCGFCGELALRFHIRCGSNDCCAEGPMRSSEAEAIIAWNKLPRLAELQQIRASMNAAVVRKLQLGDDADTLSVYVDQLDRVLTRYKK